MTRMLARSTPFCPIVQLTSGVTLGVRLCHSRSVVQLGHKARVESTQQTYLEKGIHRATDMMCELSNGDWVLRRCFVSGLYLSPEIVVTWPLKFTQHRQNKYHATIRGQRYTPRYGYRWCIYPREELASVRRGVFDNDHGPHHPERALKPRSPG